MLKDGLFKIKAEIIYPATIATPKVTSDPSISSFTVIKNTMATASAVIVMTEIHSKRSCTVLTNVADGVLAVSASAAFKIFLNGAG